MPWNKALEPQYDDLLSIFAFNIIVRRYTEGAVSWTFDAFSFADVGPVGC
jgi:hypothetical protein